MTKVRLEHGVATARMGQLYVEGMTIKRERHVMSITRMDKCEKDDSKSWVR